MGITTHHITTWTELGKPSRHPWFGIGPVGLPGHVVGFSISFGRRSIAIHRKL